MANKDQLYQEVESWGNGKLKAENGKLKTETKVPTVKAKHI